MKTKEPPAATSADQHQPARHAQPAVIPIPERYPIAAGARGGDRQEQDQDRQRSANEEISQDVRPEHALLHRSGFLVEASIQSHPDSKINRKSTGKGNTGPDRKPVGAASRAAPA